jgi:hypothetical protein
MSVEAQPKLDRMKNPYSSGSFEQGEYVPENYSEVASDTIVTRAMYAFPTLFGIPHELVTTSFRNYAKDVLKRRHPFLNCSAARAIFEGRIPGIPKPTAHFRNSKMMQQCIYLLDLCETLLTDWVKNGVDNATDDQRTTDGGTDPVSSPPGESAPRPEGAADVPGSESQVEPTPAGDTNRNRKHRRNRNR